MHPNKHLIIIISAVAFASAFGATEQEKIPAFDSTFTFLTATTDIKPTEIGAAINALLDKCDRVEAKLLPAKGTKVGSTLPIDKGVVSRLKLPLGTAIYQKTDLCYCVSYPSFSFYKGGRLLVSMSFPHGHKIRFSGRSLSGDYEVGEAVVQEATSILNSTK